MELGCWAMQRLMEYPIVSGAQERDLLTFIEEGWFYRAGIWMGPPGLSSSFATDAGKSLRPRLSEAINEGGGRVAQNSHIPTHLKWELACFGHSWQKAFAKKKPKGNEVWRDFLDKGGSLTPLLGKHDALGWPKAWNHLSGLLKIEVPLMNLQTGLFFNTFYLMLVFPSQLSNYRLPTSPIRY